MLIIARLNSGNPSRSGCGGANGARDRLLERSRAVPELRALVRRSRSLVRIAIIARSRGGTAVSGRGFSIPRPWNRFSGGSCASSSGILCLGRPSSVLLVTSDVVLPKYSRVPDRVGYKVSCAMPM